MPSGPKQPLGKGGGEEFFMAIGVVIIISALIGLFINAIVPARAPAPSNYICGVEE